MQRVKIEVFDRMHIYSETAWQGRMYRLQIVKRAGYVPISIQMYCMLLRLLLHAALPSCEWKNLISFIFLSRADGRVEARGSLKDWSLDGVEAFQSSIWTIDFYGGSFLGTNLWVHKDQVPQRGQIRGVAVAKKTSSLIGWIISSWTRKIVKYLLMETRESLV